MAKNVIRLTEGDLHSLISDAVKNYINEVMTHGNPLEGEEETFKNNQNYSHFAVNKDTNKIVNGWDYSDYDPSELRQFKRDYFYNDLIDYELDPKQYRIVTGKHLIRQGIDPNDNSNWANS